MNKPTIQLESRSAEATATLGEWFGSRAEPGDVMALCGDLGCGKTVFVQGVARGLAVPENFYVTSPTYTIINEYPGRLPLFHMDLYRIADMETLDETGFYAVFEGRGVVAIEWAERLDKSFFNDFNVLKFDFKTLTENSRSISITAFGKPIAGLPELFSGMERKWD